MKKNLIVIITFISLIILSMGMINGEERPIYVGDIIELTIDSSTHSISDVESAFEDFEIIELSKDEDKYLLKIRSFEVREQRVILGNTELVISISTLLSEDDNELKVGNVDLEKSGLALPWTIVKFILLGLSIIGLTALLLLLIRDRPRKPISNYDQLINQVTLLGIENEDYAYRLTRLFKIYLSKIFNESLTGLTSIELVNRISKAEKMKEYMVMIEKWLNKCDTYKYSKDKASVETKKILKEDLLFIVTSINEKCEVEES